MALLLPESWDTRKAGPALKSAKTKRRETLRNAPRAAAPAGTKVELDVEAVTEAARARRNRCGIPVQERASSEMDAGC